jgi:probable F420-dependent oxidoreductase
MKVDASLHFADAGIGDAARRFELLGYDGVWSAETSHDPFLPLALAADATHRIRLGTAISVAFARNPMTLATVSHDLQVLSKGRFILGLGTQIKPHITKRYSMPWSRPAARMRELVLAIRAIWATWDTGEPLAFRGEFYTHTLMTPMFSPSPNPYRTPPIVLAAVGGRMTEVAGEVADGMLVHPFTTARYLREVTVPALERGAARAGRTRGDLELSYLELSYPGLLVTGRDERELAAAAKSTREQIAFYASTPAYRPVLDLHGWADLQSELHTLSRQGEWTAMGERIDDEILRTFAVVAPLEEIAAQVIERFGGLVDRFGFNTPYPLDDQALGSAIEQLRSA